MELHPQKVQIASFSLKTGQSSDTQPYMEKQLELTYLLLQSPPLPLLSPPAIPHSCPCGYPHGFSQTTSYQVPVKDITILSHLILFWIPTLHIQCSYFTGKDTEAQRVSPTAQVWMWICPKAFFLSSANGGKPNGK